MVITIPMVKKFPGTIIFSKPLTEFKPSIAEDTEIGGVIIPSANNVVAPSIVGITKYLLYLRTSAYKENTPPSPWLSARRVNQMYFTVVWNNNVQKTNEIPPYTRVSLIRLSPIMALNT